MSDKIARPLDRDSVDIGAEIGMCVEYYESGELLRKCSERDSSSDTLLGKKRAPIYWKLLTRLPIDDLAAAVTKPTFEACAPNARTMSAPIPEAPPVTNTIRFFIRRSEGSYRFLLAPHSFFNDRHSFWDDRYLVRYRTRIVHDRHSVTTTAIELARKKRPSVDLIEVIIRDAGGRRPFGRCEQRAGGNKK